MTTKPAASPPTTNKHLIRWVEKMAELTQPANIHWVDGSQSEYEMLCDKLVEAGTFFPLDEKKWPGCFYARSVPTDVARVEDRTRSEEGRVGKEGRTRPPSVALVV